jgi:hypothetical protein
MTDSLKAAARAGDIKTLEALMNKSFASKGVTVRVTNSGALLKIVVRGKEAPEKALLPTIQKAVRQAARAGLPAHPQKIRILAEDPRPSGSLKLKGVDTEYRIRIGDYRLQRGNGRGG